MTPENKDMTEVASQLNEAIDRQLAIILSLQADMLELGIVETRVKMVQSLTETLALLSSLDLDKGDR